MAYFQKDFINFFKELEENNNKDWFDENRSRYEKIVKKPFKEFVALMIAEISQIDPTIALQPKDAIFRINRDIRFSKDKTPYKTNVSAVIAPGGRKDHTYPGLYFELRADRVGVYGGVYGADKDTLYKIRSYMAENPKEFFEAIEDKNFNKYYGGKIYGERNKVLPNEFKEAGSSNEYLYNKQWYYMTQLPASVIFSDDLNEILSNHFIAAKKLRKYFLNAIL